MIRSMTAFGRHRGLCPSGDRDITAEIKSVNNRFLDCNVKLPRSYGYLEEKIKSYISERGITRGKVDVFIGIDVIEETGAEVSLDRAAAESHLTALPPRLILHPSEHCATSSVLRTTSPL